MRDNTLGVNFWLLGQREQFAFRRLYHAPRVGDLIVFQGETRYTVLYVEWCLADDATGAGTRINVELDYAPLNNVKIEVGLLE